ncbi:hypothetical protein C0Q70_01908 [Pomacea canaliculata]|uniref:BZIP domain-containing protein n=2 Tax=Pomacea canaliculata TaxID=400727 RepID=A0A2T7Q0V9_POMCA|nr:hypothetical protein C0Q70_01908 [Pomacea canaliculata]
MGSSNIFKATDHKGNLASSSSTQTSANLNHTMEECSSEDKNLRRLKNREAAKRCRDKKLHLTEELQKKNQELQDDNRRLADEKMKLIKKCKRYKKEIEEHKRQGCVVEQRNTVADLDKFMDALLQMPSEEYTSSSSISLSSEDSTGSESMSPLPTASSSILAGNGNESLTALTGQVSGNKTIASNQCFDFGVSDSPYNMKSVSPNAEDLPQKLSSKDPDIHYITVRTKDGSIKHLAIRRAQYAELMNQIAANKHPHQQGVDICRPEVITTSPSSYYTRTMLTNATVPHHNSVSQLPQVFHPQHRENVNMTQAAVLLEGGMTHAFQGQTFSNLELASVIHESSEGSQNVVDCDITFLL